MKKHGSGQLAAALGVVLVHSLMAAFNVYHLRSTDMRAECGKADSSSADEGMISITSCPCHSGICGGA